MDMKLGNIEIIKRECVERTCDFVSDDCEQCQKPATKRHTFLYENSRSNPASSGHHRDDVSWCSDGEKFSCDEHQDIIRRDHPEDMDWCSTFSRNKGFEHMFLYWKEKKEEK